MLNFDRTTAKHALRNTQNDCHQWLSRSFRVHRIRFRPGLRWGSLQRSPRLPLSGSLELKIGTTVLKRVTTCKYLGIIIDDKLSWNDHIDYVYKKLPNLLVYSTVYVIDYLVNY